MINLSSSVSATVTLSQACPSAFHDLPSLVARTLDQANIRVFDVELAYHGDDIVYGTDEGRIEVTSTRRESGRRIVDIRCDALVTGTREIARQICYQLVRRVIAQADVEAIFWHPTRQSLEPSQFRWGALRDMPQRFAGPQTILAGMSRSEHLI